MQEMKFVHNVHQEVDRLSLYVGTWNMGNEPAPTDIHNWLLCQGCGKSRDKVLTVIPHDMYAIGTQESAMTEKEWIARLQRTLSDCLQTDFVPVTTSVLWDIRLVILVKPEYKNKITHIQQSTVKTGIANALGNKGAAAISFSFNGTSFCFINCHLTSGVEKNHRRNQNVIDIIKGLNLGTKALNVFDITNQFHHVFFLGDLNYRIDGMEPVSVIDKIRQEKYQTLLQYDQLTISRDRNQCFVGFVEEEITFPPTYRIARGSEDKYEWQKFKKTCVKINAPSWCDRVLHKSYPGTYIINTSYGCVNTVMTSDHKPVFSSFDVGIISQFAGTRSVSSLTDKSDVMIIFENVKAEIKTSTKEQFKLEFYSSCLEAPVVSNCNWEFGDHCHSLSRPQWSAPQIPQMCPFVQDRDYLEDQHLLVALKSDDGMESYGECVIPLKSKFSLKAQPFTYNLTHYSQETGLLTGNMYVKSKDNKIKPNRRSFELIYMDTDTLFFQRQLLQAPKLEEKTSSLGESSLLQADQRSPDPKQPNTCESSSLSSLVSSSSSSSSSSSASSSQLKANGKPTLGKQSDQLLAVRKPRMGQSSLCPINVLPVTRSANPVQAPSGGNEYVYTGSHSQSIPDVDGSNGQPAPEKRFEKSSSDHKQNPAYDTLRKPSSIKEWLTDLGFEQYIPHFLENGWDNLSFIQDLTDHHLRDINVRVPEHRSKILKSIAILHGHSSSAV
ncbi:hypothetical protein LSH36_1040g00029 [Paralvinella palmiformis]|uniref:phosphatidylinositol-3,4,5-trisphosphate 5-phosphatase n=1 Tax=Paralvinella palmiformis TaxID=53620 RepID=A0AAD9MQK6_9ANNE|nr:hypothetical protein LSH36_1040g00029 [Paralvinella palmiformis]